MSPPEETPEPFWCHIVSDQSGGDSAGEDWADWLEEEISSYVIPAKLAGRVNLRGETIPSGRLTVCVTHFSPQAASEITDELAAKLARSLNLIVLCSPWASRSPLVDQVVRTYKMSGRSNRLLAAIISGIPHARAEDTDKECFPAATRFNVDEDGELLGTPAEPIAADFRTADGGDGWTDPADYLDALLEADVDGSEAEGLAKAYATRLQLMKLKVIAGILGVSLGELTERDIAHQRQLRTSQRNQTLIRFGILSLLGAVGVWAGMLAWRSYEEAQVAKQRALQNSQIADAEAKAAEEARKAAERTRPRRLTDEALKLLEAGDAASRAQARARLREAAGFGFAPAQFQLAMLLFQEDARADATDWLRKAAAQNHPPAINLIGENHRDRKNGFEGGRDEAARQFRIAAELNFGPAQANLGRLAEENLPGLGGVTEALKWYLKAAENKDGFALFRLHRLYSPDSKGVTPDSAKENAYLEAAAEAGNADAQWALGNRLVHGFGRPKDLTRGASFLRKVAANHDAPRLAELAQIQLALLYRDGQMRVASTADGDLDEALRMLKSVAEKGSADACYNLATTYADSRLSVADEASSLFWYRRAADLGNAESRLLMARKLLSGLRDNLVLHEATRWLNAREGMAAGEDPYPVLFLDPKHGYASAAKDYRDAVAWLKEARANQRNQAAAHKVFLAELYLTQDFHEDDRFAEAFALLNEAMNMKDALAEAMLSAIYEKGHPPQVTADPTKAAELRKSSLATNKPGPRAYFERKDRVEKNSRAISADYVKSLQQAAGRGEGKAQTELGLHYLHFEPYQRTPLPLDISKAAEQLAPGALNADSLALMGLGLTFRQAKDLPNRFKLHLKAAQNGDEPLACLWTGTALEQGLGTAVDLIEAYKWYLIAFKYGQEGSSAAKKRAELQLTAAQQVEARKRADEYKPIKTKTEMTAVQAPRPEKENRPPKEEARPAAAKKANKPEPGTPTPSAKPARFLVDEAERILAINNASPEEIEKALEYAMAALAKNRSNTQAMDAAWKAAGRKGDYETSHKWLLTIANQKLSNSTNPNLNRLAMAYLSNNCEAGTGTPADNVEAYKWRLLELKAMSQTSSPQLEQLESKMTPSEISEARKRAKAFRPTGF